MSPLARPPSDKSTRSETACFWVWWGLKLCDLRILGTVAWRNLESYQSTMTSWAVNSWVDLADTVPRMTTSSVMCSPPGGLNCQARLKSTGEEVAIKVQVPNAERMFRTSAERINACVQLVFQVPCISISCTWTPCLVKSCWVHSFWYPENSCTKMGSKRFVCLQGLTSLAWRCSKLRDVCRRKPQVWCGLLKLNWLFTVVMYSKLLSFSLVVQSW